MSSTEHIEQNAAHENTSGPDQPRDPVTRYPAGIDYLVFSVMDLTLALPFFDIIQLVDLPRCTAVPSMPHYVRGVIDFMGEPIPLIDTRVRLSMKSRADEVAELVQTFLQRKQDHLNWIARLKDAVEQDKEITVEKNPHKCAFGKWYDTYRANTLTLKSYMQRFDLPHKAIHNLAVRAEQMIRDGQKQQAKQMIREAEQNELKTLIGLFDGFEEQMRLSYHEYAVVVHQQGCKLALAIDSVRYFETLDEIMPGLPLSGTIHDKVVSGIGRKTFEHVTEEVMLLDLDVFIPAETDLIIEKKL